MRVFCPEHNKGFFTPRQSPIRCQSRGHVLGELDFHGTAKAPAEIRWQYCCNCEHFCPTDFSRDGLERCPACTRRSSNLYLCDRCFTVSFESNTPLQTKNFTLTTEGAPEPSCPGCLQAASTELREHECDELRARLITALDSCPACNERLDVGPQFPSLIVHYLKKTKSANKVNVTFDYETELFVSVDDGEFVVISNSAEGTIVLPRAGRFLSKRDFYELYQDYYHCANVVEGEVQVVEPATVEAVAGGWRLQSTGILEVVVAESNIPAARAVVKSVTLPAAKTKEEPPVREKPAPAIAPVAAQPTASQCLNCGSLVEAKYAFCWQCGNSMKPEQKKQAPSPRPIRRVQVKEDEANPQQEIDNIQQSILSSVPSWRRFAAEDDESTVQHDRERVRPTNSSWELAKQRVVSSSGYGSILKLGAIAIVGVLLTTLGIFAFRQSVVQLGIAAETPAAAASLPEARFDGSRVVAAVAAIPGKKVETPEDELRKLRERQIGAGASERTTLLRAFARTERRYPNDYRFPYERARLALKRREAAARKDAIKALSVAAEKAIRADKAREMLQGLEADKRGDFQTLASGTREWRQVVEALRSNDATLLETNTQ